MFCKGASAIFAIAAVAYAAVTVPPLLGAPDNTEAAGLLASLEQTQLVLNCLTTAKIALISGLFAFAGRRGGSLFSREIAWGLLILGIVFAAHACVEPVVVSEALSLLFAGDALRTPVLIQTFDASGLTMALCLVFASFAVRYARDLRVDSEDIA